jgi:hypothetical protein
MNYPSGLEHAISPAMGANTQRGRPMLHQRSPSTPWHVEKSLLRATQHHFMRKPHPRRARTKNGDARLGVSLISIHWRRAKSERVSDYKTYPRRALRVSITYWNAGWGPYGSNTRHTQDRASPITKKFETRFILARHRFNCRLGHCDTNRRHTLLDVHLIFHAPQRASWL